MKEPTLKMKNAMMDYILNPMVPIIKIAERNDVKYDSLRMALKKNRDWIEEKSMEIWREKKIMAMRVLEEKAQRGDFRALEFLLRANGINPEQRVVNSDQEIHITLENKEEN